MKLLQKIKRVIDRLNEWVGSFSGWLSTLLVLVVCYDVFTRYLLNESSIAVQELEWHLFAAIFLLGAAFTLKNDRHVRVDVLYHTLSERTKAWINLAGSLVFLLPFAIMVIYTSQKFVGNSFTINETSPDPGGLPARYILKACIPAGFILLALQGISETIQALMTILKPKKTKSEISEK